MEAINVTFPAISSEVIAQIEETEQVLAATEREFIAALRERYATLAQYNGFVKTSHYAVGDGSNWSAEGSTYLEDSSGDRIKGLRAYEGFYSEKTEQFAGVYGGSNLYLTDTGWVEVTRAGNWSNWQGSDNYWTCSGYFADGRRFDTDGYMLIQRPTDEQVAAAYDVAKVAAQLSASLAKLAEKLPARLTRKRALAESLAAAVAAMKGGK